MNTILHKKGEIIIEDEKFTNFVNKISVDIGTSANISNHINELISVFYLV